MGGSPDPPPDRSLPNELGGIFNVLNKNELPNYQNYFQNQPLLQGSQNLALLGQQQLPGIQQAYQGDIGQLQGYQDQLAALQGQIPGLQGELSTYQGQLPEYQKQLAGYQGQLAGLQAPLQGGLDYLSPILASGGALTGQEARDVSQQAQAGFAARGNLYGNQSLGAELLNRDQYKQQKFGQAAAEAQGLTGSIGSLLGQQAGLTGQRLGVTQAGAGITGQKAGLTQLLEHFIGSGAGVLAQKAGLTDMLQGAIGKAINPALQTQQTGIGTYATLLDPLLNYGSDLYNTNYNAQAASNIAGGNKGSSIAGGALSLVGSAAAAY